MDGVRGSRTAVRVLGTDCSVGAVPSTAFAFNGHSANAVNGKLQQLKTILPPEIIDLPSWTPPELLRDTLARGKLLLEIADQLLQCKDGRS